VLAAIRARASTGKAAPATTNKPALRKARRFETISFGSLTYISAISLTLSSTVQSISQGICSKLIARLVPPWQQKRAQSNV
jgi:hypothetical protein